MGRSTSDRLVALGLAAALVLSGCAAGRADGGEALTVVATTEILADLVAQVGGERVRVSSIVPPGADPHSYEPTPRNAAEVARADVTFTNHLLLEEHALIKTIDANARADAPNVSLAEAAESYGATVIPLVEDLGLDVVWLGLAVRGDGAARGASRASDIRLTATSVDGPGRLVAYLTGSLGEPQRYFDSGDGIDGQDSTTLPPAAHTHLNWAFTAPGVYRLGLAAQLVNPGVAPVQVGAATFTFAVGVDPHTVGAATVISAGHTDLAVDLDAEKLYAYSDSGSGQQRVLDPATLVVDVPNRAIDTVPTDPRFGFLGQPGAVVHQLPQAVLGKHVHGEIDPHLWQDAANVKAYVQLIRDTLVKRDPGGEQRYRDNARRYLAQLDDLDRFLRTEIGTIPPERRQLITTHDAFGYLAKAYGLTVAGFVVPNPAQEPSADQVRKLTETIRNLRVPAVFMEPNLRQRATVLTQVAADQHIRVCSLYGDTFDDQARDYLTMMRHNATELRTCLGGAV